MMKINPLNNGRLALSLSPESKNKLIAVAKADGRTVTSWLRSRISREFAALPAEERAKVTWPGKGALENE